MDSEKMLQKQAEEFLKFLNWSFASVAKKQGFEQIAALFLKTAEVFAKSEVKVWECRNCGHIVVGTKAPEICPTCNHPQSYFEVHAENY